MLQASRWKASARMVERRSAEVVRRDWQRAERRRRPSAWRERRTRMAAADRDWRGAAGVGRRVAWRSRYRTHRRAEGCGGCRRTGRRRGRLRMRRRRLRNPMGRRVPWGALENPQGGQAEAGDGAEQGISVAGESGAGVQERAGLAEAGGEKAR